MNEDKSKIIKYQGTPSEVSSLRSMCTLWKTDSFWDFDSVLKTLSQNDCSLFYVLDPEQKSWIASLIIKGDIEFCEIIYIFTHPNFRKQNLAHDLLNNLIVELNKYSQLKYIILEVRPSNKAAISLYESFGFFKVAKRLKYYSNQEDALIYRLEL